MWCDEFDGEFVEFDVFEEFGEREGKVIVVGVGGYKLIWERGSGEDGGDGCVGLGERGGVGVGRWVIV